MTKPTIIRKRDPARSEASLLEILIERDPVRAELIIKRLKKNGTDKREKSLAVTPDKNNSL